MVRDGMRQVTDARRGDTWSADEGRVILWPPSTILLVTWDTWWHAINCDYSSQGLSNAHTNGLVDRILWESGNALLWGRGANGKRTPGFFNNRLKISGERIHFGVHR